MDIALTRSYAQTMDWLAVGKFALYFFNRGSDDAKKQGLPVDEFTPSQFKETGLLGPSRGVLARINRAPHPNAAKVFINWVLSREGQLAFQRISAADNPSSGNSMREDISKDMIPLEYRRVKGVNYLQATDQIYKTRPAILEIVKKILRERGK